MRAASVFAVRALKHLLSTILLGAHRTCAGVVNFQNMKKSFAHNFFIYNFHKNSKFRNAWNDEDVSVVVENQMFFVPHFHGCFILLRRWMFFSISSVCNITLDDSSVAIAQPTSMKYVG